MTPTTGRARGLALFIVACGFLVAGAGATAQTQGVTRTEIVVGSILDMSGPLAGYGKEARNGMQMRINEANAQGGVNGRQLKLIVEDSGYDPKRAVLAAQKLVNQEHIFVMIGSLGTAVNQAAVPIQSAKNIVNFFPMALGRDMYEPVSKHKFAWQPPNFDIVRRAAPALYQQKKASRACVIYQDDDFGLELVRGAEAGLKAINVELVERSSYKRGATEFASQVSKLKAANCDFVVMGTLIRETVGVVNEARKLGFEPTMIASSAAYSELIPKLGGKAMDGFYAAMWAQIPYEDEGSPEVRKWAQTYKAAFNEPAAMFSIYGYAIADKMIRAITQAGLDLTTESFVKAIESTKFPVDIFGNPELVFSPANHLGTTQMRLSQIQDGRWRVVRDYDPVK